MIKVFLDIESIMDLEENTPVVESKDFGVEPMLTSVQTLTPTR